MLPGPLFNEQLHLRHTQLRGRPDQERKKKLDAKVGHELVPKREEEIREELTLRVERGPIPLVGEERKERVRSLRGVASFQSLPHFLPRPRRSRPKAVVTNDQVSEVLAGRAGCAKKKAQLREHR